MSIFTSILLAGLLSAEMQDTLHSVTVVADRGVVVSRTDTISVNQSQQSITGLLMQNPSAFIGDYGGAAGLKTVSLRGMGSPHTSIYIDGVRIGDVQNGQRDLGQIGLENFSSAVIDYAQNSLSFITARPRFEQGRKTGGKAGMSAGSFGTYLPYGKIDRKLSDRLSASVNADAVFSKGDFSYGNRMHRENNDIKRLNAGVDLFGTFSQASLHTKAGFHSSDRGTPGPLSYPSADRQQDRNIFIQSLMKSQIARRYSLTASAKIAYDETFYTSSYGDSRYAQTEAQLNTSHKFNVNRWLVMSLAADIIWDDLKSTNYNRQRLGTTEAVSAALRRGRFSADAAIQHDGIFDQNALSINCFSPSIDMRYRLFEGFDIIAFGRRAYRAPAFNELYYEGYGNPDLKAEDAWLSDIGLDWTRRAGGWSVHSKIDLYRNYLSNKITSAPNPDNPSFWLPYNIGRVRSSGADICTEAGRKINRSEIRISARYSFQDAVDKTPDSLNYDCQIAYIARHSLYLNARAAIGNWSADASWNLRCGRRDSYGQMPDWNTLDLFFSKGFKSGVTLKIILKNVTDNRYELSSGYPMPGFSITGGFDYRF